MTEIYSSRDEVLERLKDMEDELTEHDHVVIDAALEDASAQAQFHGTYWPATAAPPLVHSIVRSAVVRHIRLLDARVLDRTGDETSQWTDLGEKTGTVFLDDEQKAMLRVLAGKSAGLHSVSVTAWTSPGRSRGFNGLVPVGGAGNKPIQYYPPGWA